MDFMDLKRPLVFLALFCLLAAALLAAPVDDAQYVTVVRESDGPLGVISAANFAAAMQVHNARFTGALFSDLPKIKGLEKKFLLFFNGRQASIVDGKGDPSIAAFAREWLEAHNYTVEVATLGEVAPELAAKNEPSGSQGALEELGDDPATEQNQDQELNPDHCGGCTFGSQCLAPGTRTATQYCAEGGEMLLLKARGEACANDYECYTGECVSGVCGGARESPGSDADADANSDSLPPSPDSLGSQTRKPGNKGFFARLLSWLAGLFS